MSLMCIHEHVITYLSLSSVGAGIANLHDTSISPLFAQLPYNPLCSLLYEELSVPPDDWKVSLSLSDPCSFISFSGENAFL